MPSISVLIPLYNKDSFIADAIDSVLQQTFIDWEIVIVDDSSTDNSVKVAEEFLPGFPITLITLPDHLGCAGATHAAVMNAVSPICTILDGDDLLHEDSLRIISSVFNSDPELAYMWTRYIARSEGSDNWKEGRSKDLPSNLSLKQALLSGWWGALAQRSFRKDAYLQSGGLDESLPYAVDQQLASLFAAMEVKVRHLPVVTYYHIQHNNQMSATHYRDQQHCRGEILRGLGGEYIKER